MAEYYGHGMGAGNPNEVPEEGQLGFVDQDHQGPVGGQDGLYYYDGFGYPQQPPVQPAAQPSVAQYPEQPNQQSQQEPQVLAVTPPVAVEPEAPVFRCEPCNTSFPSDKERKTHMRIQHQSSMMNGYGLVFSRRSESNNHFACCYHGCEKMYQDPKTLNSHVHPTRGDMAHMIQEQDLTIPRPEHKHYWAWLSQLREMTDVVQMAKNFEASCHQQGHRHKFVIMETPLPSIGFKMAARCFVLAMYDATIGLDASEENGQFVVLDTRLLPRNLVGQA